MMRQMCVLAWLALVLAAMGAWAEDAAKEVPTPEQQEAVFVDKGKAELVREIGRKWTQGDGYLECSGPDNYLQAGMAVGSGDFRITVELTILNLERSAASLVIGDDSHFGFAGGNNKMFVEGPFFRGEAKFLDPAEGTVPEGKPFVVEVVRKGAKTEFFIGGKKVHSHGPDVAPIGRIALRPWRSTMRVHRFVATGRMLDLPRPPANAPDASAMPSLDASHQTDVYVSGEDGYHTYRIPSVIVTPKGTVLAFCEGRKKGGGDSGDIDLVLKRSEDGGRTFAKQQVVWDDAENTCGNPCPVIDRNSGTIWLLLTHNLGTDSEGQIVARKSKGTRTVWVSRSDDDGRTWAKPVEITKDTKKPEWSWYATGPGCGIQLRSGRLVVPCDHIADGGEWASHVIYSDDAGKTWKLGGSAPPKTNECEVVELADGRLALNMRNYNRLHRCRAVATSSDGGLTWSEVSYDETLVEPVCQASIRRLSRADPNVPGAKDRILFSNPGSAERRKALTVRLSEDEGKSWPVARLLWAGPAAYSCLAVMPDGTILCLYERGDKGAHEKITLARFDAAWLTGGKE